MKYLDDVKNYIRDLEPKLSTMVQDGVKFAVMKDSDGDSTLFNGLLASVWQGCENWPLRAVFGSQGDNGMFFRSPRRRATNNAGYSTFFSRDQASGVLAAATNPGFEARVWNRWLDYISGSRSCLVKKPWGGGCLIRSPIYKYATDDRSDISPSCWAMMGRVASGRGWGSRLEMEKWKGYDGDASVIEAKNCEKGYQLHLKAVDAFIKFCMGQSREYSQKVGDIAYSRVPDNLFYEFLSKRYITDDFIKRYLDISPPIAGVFGNGWVWQSACVADELPYSSGWDFIFLGNLILYICKQG